jgi:DedD protein
MPPDLHNDQELVFKKRARRRLVGAVALVILMVIILPRILLDRAALTPHEAVKISMPELDVAKPAAVEPSAAKANASPSPVADSAVSDEVVIPEANVATQVTVAAKLASEVTNNDVKKVAAEKNVIESVKVEDKTDVESADNKKIEAKVSETKSKQVILAESKVTASKKVEAKSQKHAGSFTIQIGVFSDAANVKLLQAKLKKVGLSSRTENISTEKGEKIRLKAGSFASRSDAVSALSKLQSANLSGMVVSND